MENKVYREPTESEMFWFIGSANKAYNEGKIYHNGVWVTPEQYKIFLNSGNSAQKMATGGPLQPILEKDLDFQLNYDPSYNLNFATSPYGNYYNPSQTYKNNTVIEEINIEVSDEQYKQAEMFRVFQCGKPYGILEILGFCWVILGRKFNKHWPNPFNDGIDSYVCSSVVCRQIGLLDDATITPADLYEILKKSESVYK